MNQYGLQHATRKKRGRASRGRAVLWAYWKKWWWLVPFLLFDLWVFGRFFNRPGDGATGGCLGPDVEDRAAEKSAAEKPADRPQPPLLFVPPTPQTNLLNTASTSVYMATGSGRLESAMFGSTRTRKYGNAFLPAHHEGIDIAPMQRDRTGAPTDLVVAAADGMVAYANRIAGNSSYGCYVVVLHEDPVGTIYTLYAHLASVDRSVHADLPVKAGRTLGIMGYTSTLGIPRERAHLHFEVGLLLNRRFDRWYRAQKLKPDHGMYHGWNFSGIDPVEVFRTMQTAGRFSMKAYLAARPVAFEIGLCPAKPLDYFLRYPSLWHGPHPAQGPMVLSVSDAGNIIAGRPATDEEQKAIGGKGPAVLNADENILGRNGLRLVSRSSGTWAVGSNGRRWLDVLTY